MKISIVTDEISSDIETAIELGTVWGIHDFELRDDGSRVPNISAFELARTKRPSKPTTSASSQSRRVCSRFHIP